MTEKELLAAFEQRSLAANQAAFAASFCASDSPRRHQLVAGVGMGKSFTTAAIIDHMRRTGAAKHILLLLSPAVLVSPWVAGLHRVQSETPVSVIDRRQFRELEATGTVDCPVTLSTGVSVISSNVAREPAVADCLASVPWDLVVVDDADRVATEGHSRKLALQLFSACPDAKILLLRRGPADQTPGGPEVDSLFANVTATVWSPPSVQFNPDRTPAGTNRLQVVPYELRPEEQSVLRALQQHGQPPSISETLERLKEKLWPVALSGWFALEQRLNRIRTFRSTLDRVEACAAEDDDEVAVDFDRTFLDECLKDRESKWTTYADRVLDAIEQVSRESKFEALMHLIYSLGVEAQDCRTCVVTRYIDTVSFLESGLSDRFRRVDTLSEVMSAEEVEQVMRKFAADGELLVVTASMIKAIPDVGSIVLYDIPLDDAGIDSQLAWSVHVGSNGPIRVFALAEKSDFRNIDRLQRKWAELAQGLRRLEDSSAQGLGEPMPPEDSISGGE